jgi:hypothetical protein
MGAFGHLPDWLAVPGLTGAGAMGYYLVQSFIAWRKHAKEQEKARSSTGLEIKKHRDGLMLDLLEQARAELAVARTEIKELRGELEIRDDQLDRVRRIEWRLEYYDEAIDHIEALLSAEIEGGREAKEHAARLFMARHEAMKLRAGELAQKEQQHRAARKLIEKRDGDE